jgi:ATP/maltotriose-dependent transcriptional regulator MalT
MNMPDGCKAELDGEVDFPFWGRQTPVLLQDIRLDLERARRMMPASQVDHALMVLEAIERQLDDLSLLVAIRYRAATKLLRLTVVALEGEGLAVIAQDCVEGEAGLGMVSIEARSRMEPFGSTDQRTPAPMKSAGNGGMSLDRTVGDAITTRERDVLSMIGQGCSNKRIARALKISPETVKSHVKRIFSKLSVSTRTEAVSRALSLRLL